MQTIEEFAATFPSERILHQALARLLAKIPGHSGVQVLQGADEIGKDIIFYTSGPFGQKELNACVVKNTRITGDAQKTAGARTVFNQAQQALDTRMLDENGHEQQVKRVFIITPHAIPQATTASIVGALRTGSDRIQFIGGATLLGLFKDYWPEYLAEEYKLIQSYADLLGKAATTSKELEGLSFQYQLGAIDTSIRRVYVKPTFHRTIRSYSLDRLLNAIPSEITDRAYSQQSIKSITVALRAALGLVSTLTEWGLCNADDGSAAQDACASLISELDNSWSLAMAGRVAAASGALVQAETFSVRLTRIRELNQLTQTTLRRLSRALERFRQELHLVEERLRRTKNGEQTVLDGDRMYGSLDEIARTVGQSWIRETDELQSSFTSEAIETYGGPLFIVAPAGFGKTSFCRWHALNDLEALAQGRTNILPVYVPLHQLGRIDNKDFRGAFLKHAGASALLPKGTDVPFERIRVYLDGLDEVSSEATQRRVADLARDASERDRTIQIIITARDYVFGPSVSWLPRVHLSGFGEDQIKELASNWLDHDEAKIEAFFTQLRIVPVLNEMMDIPLLATLIVLVFKQTGKLPESKTRLYEMFVDLHNGGWDLAKGIQRPSRFTAAEKMFLLKRIALKIHGARRRELLDDQCSIVAEETFKKVDWVALKGELTRDGLLIQLGNLVGFAHHSFQEFLTAKQLLGDPSSTQLNRCCDDYFKGSDWWSEVLRFYADLVAKPYEIGRWIDERLQAFCGPSSQLRPKAEQRAGMLKNHMENSFPYAKL